MVQHLWGEDADVEKCTPTLQNATSAIRTALEPDIQRRQPSSFLHFIDGTYRLDLGDSATVDVEVFRKRLEGALRESEPSQKVSALSSAIGLYRGEFLPEDRFEEWTSFYRGSLIDTAASALDTLASLQFEVGDDAAAKATMLRRQEVDPD